MQALTPRGRRVELREPLEVAWLAQARGASLRNVACLPAHTSLISAARSALDPPLPLLPLPWIPPTALLNKPTSTPSIPPSILVVQAFAIYREAVANAGKPSMRTLNCVLMCMRVAWEGKQVRGCLGGSCGFCEPVGGQKWTGRVCGW